MLTISGEDQAVVQWPEEFESADVKVSVECSVDTDMKVITLHTDAAELQKAAEESGVDTAKLDTALQKLDGTYEYNLEQKELTLTEREYGGITTRNPASTIRSGAYASTASRSFSLKISLDSNSFGEIQHAEIPCSFARSSAYALALLLITPTISALVIVPSATRSMIA